MFLKYKETEQNRSIYLIFFCGIFRKQYLLTDSASLPCTTHADVTQNRQTGKYITLIQPTLPKEAWHTYRLVRNERVQVPLHKVVNSHSHIREGKIINNKQCKSVYNNPCQSVYNNQCKSVYNNPCQSVYNNQCKSVYNNPCQSVYNNQCKSVYKKCKA